MRVGTTKDQGLYNKPSAAVHPGALAAGTLLQYKSTRVSKDQKTETQKVRRLSLREKASEEHLQRIEMREWDIL